MVKFQNFNEILEQDFTRLTADVQAHREEHGSEALSKKEKIRNSIERFAEKVQPTAPVQAPDPSNGTSTIAPQSKSLPNYLQAKDADINAKHEVTVLIDIAFKHGIARAISEAKRHPAFVIDAFHDALTDHLLPEFEKRGIV